jgi:hypothetical protein
LARAHDGCVERKWSLSLGIDMKKDDRIDIAAPIIIE